jgi:hypothetical protein
MISNEIQQQIINACIHQLRKLNVSDKSLVLLIRSYHITWPFYCLFIMFFASQLYNILLIVILIIVFIMFLLFNGCILSKLEYVLDHNDITIIDPIIELCGKKVTNKNRKQFSIIISLFFLAFTFFIFYVRFGTFHLQQSIYDELNVFSNFIQK